MALSVAETMLDYARLVQRYRGVIEPCEGTDTATLAQCVTALKFARQRPALKLRAQVEEWDWLRINREMH